MQTLRLTWPDDWHTHLRDGSTLERTVQDTAAYFKRAIIMPNLVPGITTLAMARAYRNRILTYAPATFSPLMTLYLTPEVTPDSIIQGHQEGLITACKLYPRGATTNSAAGVEDLSDCYSTIEAMQTIGMPLLIHGETPAADIDIFDREKHFIENTLTPLLQRFPDLKIVLEHISTQVAVDFVITGPETLAATITAHHLLISRNDILAGGIKPHHYCLPIAKRESDRQALLQAATSGNPKFFLGTDSAPHARHTKENACGCAGIYTAFHALPLYAHAFEAVNALHKLEAFASEFGAKFYGLPTNSGKITLVKKPWVVPETLPFGDDAVVPLWATQTLQWQLNDKHIF